jgi:biopolymer transport protein ExbD
MRTLSIKIAIASLTFLIGLGAQRLLDYFVTDELVEAVETCSNYAKTLILIREPKLVAPAVNECGHFVITIGDDKQLYLNSRPMGSLDKPVVLIYQLESAFQVRRDFHVYRRGMEEAFEVPVEDRIDKTVYVRAGRSLSYGEVHDFIDTLKAAGANPIGLVSDPPRPFTDY